MGLLYEVFGRSKKRCTVCGCRLYDDSDSDICEICLDALYESDPGEITRNCIECGCILPDDFDGDMCEVCKEERDGTLPDRFKEGDIDYDY